MALHKFDTSAQLAINFLIKQRVLTPDPLSIGNFLYRTPDLNRRQLAEYVSQSPEIYEAFLASFRWVNLRLDEALRMLLFMVCLPESWESLEPLVVGFSKAWHSANQNVIGFDQEMVLKVVMATLLLNSKVWFDHQDVFGIARQMDIRYKKRPSLHVFLRRWEEYDHYGLVPHDFMEYMYHSVMTEQLETGIDTPCLEKSLGVEIFDLPSRLVLDQVSDHITLTIPEPDPGLKIRLRGQDLVFVPNILNFSSSASQSFTILGRTLGKTSFMMIKTGTSAERYFCPFRITSIVVDRSMQYILNLTDLNHRYVFGLETLQEYSAWNSALKSLCRPASKSLESQIATHVLREFLFEKQILKPSDCHLGEGLVKTIVQNSLIPLVLGFLNDSLKSS